MNEWKEYRLDEIGTIVGGGTPSSIIETYWNGNIGWITPADLSGYQYKKITHGSRNITELGLNKSSAKLHPKNTVLMTSRAPIGYLAIADSPLATNQGFQSIRCNEKIADFNFIYYLIKAHKEGIASIASGATFPEVSASKVKQYKIKLPPLTNQKKIAKILSNYDDLIDNNLSSIKLLEESAKLAYEEWFLRFRIDGKKLDIDPDTGLPFGWEKRKLTDVIELNPLTKIEKGVEHPFIPMSSLSETNMVISDIEKRISTAGTKFKNLDTLLARITPSLENGKTGFVQCLEDNEIASGSTEFIVMRSTTKISPYYVYSLARTENFREIAIQSMSGSDGRQRVKVKVFEKILLNVPSKEIRDKYHLEMKKIFNEVQLLYNQNQLLKEARDILLPRLMTGMIDTDEMDIDV